MLKIGEQLPVFTAKGQDGKDYSSDGLIGKKTVIYAYPKDGTPGCTSEACDIRDNYNRYLKLEYQVFGVSTDSIESHIKFVDKYQLPFTLLSDPDHSLLEKLGAWGEKNNYGKVSMGTIRKTFIFDEKGICVKIIDKVDTKAHTEQILG